MTQLSEHFTLAEFTTSTTASQCGIDNTPTPEAMLNLEQLAATMEKVRNVCGSNPITITSGYRCDALNKACGGASNSAHMFGLACDFIVPAFGSPLNVCKAIEPHLKEWGIDQLIHEYNDWTHLAISVPVETARCECLTINNSGTSVGFA
jgi:zinc D-Ala-D-Ala carboxypeptidase